MKLSKLLCLIMAMAMVVALCACGDTDKKEDTKAPEAVEDVEVKEEPAVEDTEIEEPAAEDTEIEEPAVEDTEIEEPAVEDTEIEEPAVEDTEIEEPAVEDTEIEELVVEDTDSDAVEAYIEANKDSIAAGFANSGADDYADIDVRADGTKVVMECKFKIDVPDLATAKAQLEETLSGAKATFESLLVALQSEEPAISGFAVRYLTKDGAVIAELEV